MRYEQLEQWYCVAWNKSISAGTSIDGIRIAGQVLHTGAMLPREWLQDVPNSRLKMLFDKRQHGLFDAYEPSADDELILYSAYPALKPSIRFKNQFEGKAQWYQVTKNAPFGIAALRTVDGVCKVGDVAKAGDIIPSQWLSALDYGQIRRLCTEGLRSRHFVKTLPQEQAKLLNQSMTFPLLRHYKPTALMLEALHEQYAGTHPNFKKQSQNDNLDNDKEQS